MRFEMSPRLWAKAYLVHLTVYTRASLPVHWITIERGETEFVSPVMKHDGFYLVRIVLNMVNTRRSTLARNSNAGAEPRRAGSGSKGKKDRVRCIDPTAAGPTFSKDMLDITLVPDDLRLVNARKSSGNISHQSSKGEIPRNV